MRFGRLGLGFGRLGAQGRGASIPIWVPKADGSLPKIYADFAAQNYWYDGAVYTDFASWRSALSGTLDGSSSRYYTTSAGLLASTTGPRFDYDPVTLLPRGLLLEGARTNLVLRSQELGTSWATTRSSVSSDVQTAPDGTASADKLVEDSTASNSHVLVQTITKGASAIQYAFSVHAKAAERSRIAIGIANASSLTNSAFVGIDISGAQIGYAGATAGTGFTFNSASVVQLANGWVRATIVATSDASTSIVPVVFLDSGSGTAANSTNYSGNGSSGVYLWGGQLEVGASASSYRPTTTGSVTRALDSFVLSSISSWFNASAGALLMTGQYSNATPDNFIQIDDGTNSNRFLLTSRGIFVASGGVTQADLRTGSAVDTSLHKVTGAWMANDFVSYQDGTQTGTDASGSIPTVDRLKIFNSIAGSAFGWAKTMGYWPSRVTNSELQRLAA